MLIHGSRFGMSCMEPLVAPTTPTCFHLGTLQSICSSGEVCIDSCSRVSKNLTMFFQHSTSEELKMGVVGKEMQLSQSFQQLEDGCSDDCYG
jgi:hypothetical protein